MAIDKNCLFGFFAIMPLSGSRSSSFGCLIRPLLAAHHPAFSRAMHPRSRAERAAGRVAAGRLFSLIFFWLASSRFFMAPAVIL
jgi:hypothetical protein